MIVKTEDSGDSTITPTLTRRGFIKMGGVLMVSFTFPGLSANAAEVEPSPGSSQLASWLEIRHDDTILVRTGRTEIGTGMSAFYAQVIAEELSVRPEAITLLMGDTDKTPDGVTLLASVPEQRTFAKLVLTPTRRCSGWPQRNSVSPSLLLPSQMALCLAAERASVTDNWFRTSTSI